MSKVFAVARREFIATVMTRAFLISVLLPPAIMGVMLVISPLLLNQASPKVSGHIAVIDRSGLVAQRLENAFSGEAIQDRRDQRMKRMTEAAPLPDNLRDKIPAAAAMQQPPAPSVTLKLLPSSADLEAEKAPIRNVTGKESGADAGDARLALIVIPAESVTASAAASDTEGFAPFQIFTAPRLDLEWQNDIESQVARAIVDARLQSSGESLDKVRRLTAFPHAEIKAVTATGEHSANQLAQILIPAAFLFLLWISVLTSGQYLLTSTIEEKSSRVMEVLLSAVSPMQLMSGKILGQLCVGGLVLIAQTGAGLIGLIAASMMHLIDPINLVYLGIYFLIAFALIASMMAAIGSAVSDIREAQTLMGPVMIVLVLPMLFMMPILRNPNSLFATVLSFVPPVSPFVMVLRLAGSEKVPTWQVPASIIVGLISVVVTMWAAAKVFRIGVLLYGKPPNLKTLIRWVRMA